MADYCSITMCFPDASTRSYVSEYGGSLERAVRGTTACMSYIREAKGTQRIQDSVESYIGTAWAVSREDDQDRKSTAFLVMGWSTLREWL